jgi:two-component system cell cycle sensor histidine kinase/response regulator CckA
LDPIVKETVKFLRASLPATIEIQHRIHSPDRTVIADPTQIHQVLMNLCTNSAHAMETGGVLEVALDEVIPACRLDQPGQDFTPVKYVRLTVRDTGHGIQKEFIDRIFEPFFTTKPRGEGTGMGLAMVHGIVRDMNGSVSADSEPGKGARFTVLIPMAKGRPELLPPSRLSPRTGGARILFVDDEKGFTASGREILAQLGYEVVVAASGHEALEIFNADSIGFDLVITDMVMPKMTGLELAKRISRACPEIPIILCTGFSAILDEEAKRNSGIHHTLMKPMLAIELTEAIEQVMKAKTH